MATAEKAPTMDIESLIRQAIIAEIGEKADRNAEELQQARQNLEDIRAEISQTKIHLANLMLKEKEYANLIRQFEIDEQMVEQRLQKALADIRGEKVTRTRKTASGSHTGSASAVQFDVMLNGKPRQYKRLVNLTWDLSQKLGRRFVVQDLYDAFESQAGIRLFSAEHQAAGMTTVDLDGIELGIAVR
jgi:formyltetrahydrofolate synthetase